MNGEIPSVPITTLAGIASLTDLLPELPLPTPLPSSVQNKSLLYDSSIAEKARKYLNSKDKRLVEQLAIALSQNSTEHIELKDSLASQNIDGECPVLLRELIAQEPHVFKGGKTKCNKTGNHKEYSRSLHHSSQSLRPSNNHHPRYAQQSSPTRLGSPGSPYIQQGELNGECSASESVVPQQNFAKKPPPATSGQVVTASPAQATVAEKIIQKHAIHQPQSSSTALSSQTEIDKNVPQKKKSSLSGPVVVLEPLDLKTLQSIKEGGKVTANCSSSKHKKTSKYNIERDVGGVGHSFKISRSRGQKRRHSTESDEDEISDDGYGDSDKYKRKKRHRSKKNVISDDEDDYIDYYEDRRSRSNSPVERVKKKSKEKKRKAFHPTLSTEELLESHTFKKFSSAMEYVFDAAEDINFGSLNPDDEDIECPPESLIPRNILSELCGEAAKLKSMNVINQVPPDKLVKLLTILQWNIRDGSKILPNLNQEEDEEEQRIWRQLSMERILRSMDASLASVYIMTSSDMPKQVYLEDVIEKLVVFTKFQLQNTVYPEFDPVYRINPDKGIVSCVVQFDRYWAQPQASPNDDLTSPCMTACLAVKRPVAYNIDGYQTNLKLKRSRAGAVKHKSTLLLYNKLTELIGCLAELIEIQELTDTIILQVSTLGVSPFFVENINEMQLNSMKLVTTVFSKYDKHRQLILEDIFASLARLPSSKRNLRNYRLNSEDSIQMVTALALQLIQCVVKLPAPETPDPTQPKESANKKDSKDSQVDSDIVIVTSYETAMRTGYNFLTVFLKKCTTKGEEDFRPLFENFVQDLLSTVNKPEWPASELLLSLLGRILVKQFSNKSTDMSLRVASLEYLGIVAARLRKDAVSSQMNQDTIDDIVLKVKDNEEDGIKTRRESTEGDDKEDQTQSLQRSLLEYLAFNSQGDPALLFSRQFYIAQWYRDTTVEAEKSKKSENHPDEEFDETEAEKTTEELEYAEKRNKFLLSQVAIDYRPFSSIKPMPSNLDYDDACLAARYLSSKRPFAQSFDVYLTQILRVLSETAVAVRTKAMKCLTAVVEADPGILGRDDMKKGVHGRFLDQSTSVREAAIELVGKFILIRPELIPDYYKMLAERILDTGISVRKRVIKIFKDICLEQPEFPKIPEMCVKMIRRVNDEEGIKKVVNDVFHNMWFVPLSTRDKDSAKLIQRVMNITDVVAACKDTGYEFFEQLLENLLKKDEDGNFNKCALTSCRQIVDCLVENVLRLEESSAEGKGCSQRLVACLSTLYLFSKIKADLMVEHATTLQPYLDIKCVTQGDYLVLHYVARILELVVPLMEHPSESFLAQLEEDMMKLILKHGQMVLQSCISCLGAVVNSVSHNYALVKDCFQKYFGVLSRFLREDPDKTMLRAKRPTLLRALFTVGLLARHFDFDAKEMGETKVSIRDKVFDVFVYFINHEEEEVRIISLTGLGFMVVNHYEYMLGRTMRDMYKEYLTKEESPLKLKCQVLKNLQAYLTEEELRMQKADAEWRKTSKKEDLKEMNDIQSGMASTIVQVYLTEVMDSFFNSQIQVRITALNVVQLILRQGLVHPVQCVPYLIAMGTDPEVSIRSKADQQLEEIEKKYPGFVHMKALQGIKMSYKLQKVLQEKSVDAIRGFRMNAENSPQSLNGFLYSLLRVNRSHRRGLLISLLNLFDDSERICLPEQIYLADNLCYFPFQTQDEALFTIHQIDIIVSVSGSNLLQSFREGLRSRQTFNEVDGTKVVEDDDDDDPDSIMARLPEDIGPLDTALRLSQGCVLLLNIKLHLKEMYSLNDSKIQQYSPSESVKIYDKPLSRRGVEGFNPSFTLQLVKSGFPNYSLSEESRRQMVDDYLEFRELMLSIDPDDNDEEDRDVEKPAVTPKLKLMFGGVPLQSIQNTQNLDGPDGLSEKHGGEHIEGGETMELASTSAAPSVSMSFTPRAPRLLMSVEKKKRSRPSKTSPKAATPSHKKKKKKKRRYASDDSDDSGDDPDFVL